VFTCGGLLILIACFCFYSLGLLQRFFVSIEAVLKKSLCFEMLFLQVTQPKIGCHKRKDRFRVKQTWLIYQLHRCFKLFKGTTKRFKFRRAE
jgi:hypothetical protein